MYTDYQDMLVPSSTVASRYYNSCTDDSTSPGNYGYPSYSEKMNVYELYRLLLLRAMTKRVVWSEWQAGLIVRTSLIQWRSVEYRFEYSDRNAIIRSGCLWNGNTHTEEGADAACGQPSTQWADVGCKQSDASYHKIHKSLPTRQTIR
jgi:hypothetical protein